ncbi:MAG: hypothetical protein ACRD3C_14860 [Vicinamibacterales bacterium]
MDPILARFQPRIPDARRFALERRVLLVETTDAVPIDIALGGLPYEGRVVARSSPFEVAAGMALTTCSAEDLVILKAFAGRAQDWIDIEGILVRQAGWLDRDLVLAELRLLLDLKEDAETEPRLITLFQKHPG